MTDVHTESESVAGSLHDEWAALYDKYSAGVWRYVASLVGSDSEVVSDAVQETFLAAARSFDRFDPSRGTIWAWLTGIAHRQIALHWRRVGRDRKTSTGIPVEEIASDGDADVRLLKLETIDAVRVVLSELPAESAAILTGKYCDDLSIAQLVELWGGTTEAVRSKLARARREFKTRFERATAEEAQTPMSIALELLNEMAQPGLRDLKVEFRGVRVAAVYPEQLPNLAAGT
ncbi:MAG TPA: sigma-70 family RNA polymerase sigma factor, partial [Planctomycetaceae bacterium]|nr:sigma-70 family RNA polymerase sigma factor [Planctomycetaceae bacterium]